MWAVKKEKGMLLRTGQDIPEIVPTQESRYLSFQHWTQCGIEKKVMVQKESGVCGDPVHVQIERCIAICAMGTGFVTSLSKTPYHAREKEEMVDAVDMP